MQAVIVDGFCVVWVRQPCLFPQVIPESREKSWRRENSGRPIG